jgi:hypothetical protein
LEQHSLLLAYCIFSDVMKAHEPISLFLIPSVSNSLCDASNITVPLWVFYLFL